MTTVVSPATSEAPITTHGRGGGWGGRAPLEHAVLVTRVEYTVDSHRTSPHKACVQSISLLLNVLCIKGLLSSYHTYRL